MIYIASDVWYGMVWAEACARETGLAVKDLTTTTVNGTVASVHPALGAYHLDCCGACMLSAHDPILTGPALYARYLVCGFSSALKIVERLGDEAAVRSFTEIITAYRGQQVQMAVQPATFEETDGKAQVTVGTGLTPEQSLLMDAFDKTATAHKHAVTRLVDITQRNMSNVHEQVRRGTAEGNACGVSMSVHGVCVICVATSGVISGASGPDRPASI